jgi:hypothetical protein
MSRPGQVQRSSTRIFSIAMILIGAAIVVRTVAAGGGVAATGVLLGALFIAAGLGRLYLASRTRTDVRQDRD